MFALNSFSLTWMEPSLLFIHVQSQCNAFFCNIAQVTELIHANDFATTSFKLFKKVIGWFLKTLTFDIYAFALQKSLQLWVLGNQHKMQTTKVIWAVLSLTRNSCILTKKSAETQGLPNFSFLLMDSVSAAVVVGVFLKYHEILRNFPTISSGFQTLVCINL